MPAYKSSFTIDCSFLLVQFYTNKSPSHLMSSFSSPQFHPLSLSIPSMYTIKNQSLLSFLLTFPLYGTLFLYRCQIILHFAAVLYKFKYFVMFVCFNICCYCKLVLCVLKPVSSHALNQVSLEMVNIAEFFTAT